jgi:preprotein translocase subunit YajC
MIEVEQQKAALGANSDQDVKPNKRFKNFNDIFSGLTRSKNVITNCPLVACIISYDSRSAITVTKEDDTLYHIK